MLVSPFGPVEVLTVVLIDPGIVTVELEVIKVVETGALDDEDIVDRISVVETEVVGGT